MIICCFLCGQKGLRALSFLLWPPQASGLFGDQQVCCSVILDLNGHFLPFFFLDKTKVDLLNIQCTLSKTLPFCSQCRLAGGQKKCCS